LSRRRCAAGTNVPVREAPMSQYAADAVFPLKIFPCPRGIIMSNWGNGNRNNLRVWSSVLKVDSLGQLGSESKYGTGLYQRLMRAVAETLRMFVHSPDACKLQTLLQDENIAKSMTMFDTVLWRREHASWRRHPLRCDVTATCESRNLNERDEEPPMCMKSPDFVRHVQLRTHGAKSRCLSHGLRRNCGTHVV